MRALLFTDIEGSTSLWEREPVAMAGALAVHDRILRTEIEDRGGVIFTTAGDSFAAAFEGPTQANDAAVAIQTALYATRWDPRTPIRVRIGVHVGETVERDGDHFGPTVNRAARVCDAGHGGQILLSEDAVRAALSASTRDLGQHRLKGVAEPVALHQLLADGLPTDFPPVRTLGMSRTSLPRVRAELIGRRDELATIHADLADHRVVTLTGPGGVGKTQLALSAAAAATSAFPDGVVFVDLSVLSDEDRVEATISEALGIGNPTELDTSQVLLVLDNCEHVVDGVADVVDSLVATTSAASVLATSREPLDIAGERAIRLRGLDPDAAVELFSARAAADAIVTDADRDAARAVCHRLDHIPLAIELAAARTRSLAVRSMPDRLEDRFRLLTGGRRRTRGRQQTLETTIAWSYDLLEPVEAETLQSLSVFAGAFALDSAASLLELDETEALDLLDALVAKSLVEARAEDELDQTVYSLLESIRVFANDRLIEEGRAEAVRQKMCDLLARDTPSIIWGGRDYYLRSADVYEAIAWAKAVGDEELNRALQLAHGAALHADGRIADGNALLRDALDHEADPARRCLALAGLSIGSAYDGDLLAARGFIDDAVQIDGGHPVTMISIFLLGSITAGIDPARAAEDLALLEAAAENPDLAQLPHGMRSMMAMWGDNPEVAAAHAETALGFGPMDAIGIYCALLELRLLALARTEEPERAVRWLDDDPLALVLPRYYRDTDSGWSYRIDLHVCSSVAALAAGERGRAHRHLAEAIAHRDQRSPQPKRNQMAIAMGTAALLFDDGDVETAQSIVRAVDAPSGGMVPGMVHFLADIEQVAEAERPAFVRSEPVSRLLLTDDVARAARNELVETAIARYGLRS